ncbi:MAG: glutamyl-tRNA reductase [Actinomycetia bacterium]|nr:glutamyl-tRNA reductase [Actinomycetes bacterium]
MTLLVVGVSHHTATMDVLESLSAISVDELRSDMIGSDQIAETMIISTCNRVEVYAEVDRFHAGVDAIVALLAKGAGLSVDEMTSRCFVHFDSRAVQHLFEVAAGLDSMVVGEPQILGQVRSAFVDAKDAGTAGRELHEVAQAALRVGKDVRSQTGLDRAGASIVSVGLALAIEAIQHSHDANDEIALDAAVLGSGAMASLAVAALGRVGAARTTIITRNPDQGNRLASGHVGLAESKEFAKLPKLLSQVNLVICCTGAAGALVSYDLVARATAGRDETLVVLDLALPRDSDPEIANLSNVSRLDLADLADRPEGQPDMDAVVAARSMIESELAVFAQQNAARAVEPVVLQLRAQTSAVVEAELNRLRTRLSGLEASDWEQVERGIRRVVATVLHTPTVRVKQLASDPDGQRYAQALSSLFDLSSDAVETVVRPRDAEFVAPPVTEEPPESSP